MLYNTFITRNQMGGPDGRAQLLVDESGFRNVPSWKRRRNGYDGPDSRGHLPERRARQQYDRSDRETCQRGCWVHLRSSERSSLVVLSVAGGRAARCRPPFRYFIQLIFIL